MTQWHIKSKRKITGGIDRSHSRSDKRLAWIGGDPSETTIASETEPQRKVVKGLGSTKKVKLKADKYVIATDKKTGKAKKLEILTVVENKADRQFARRNIITKGAVIKAKDGQIEVFVKVTSRPGQSGTIHGIILEKFEKEGEKAKKEKRESKKPQKPSKNLEEAKK
jgi:small subunit ribosomal protein S8e